MIDNLSDTYAGTTSLLSSVSDASNNLRGFKGAASAYGYDPTGNMISDSQKGITDIAYTYNDLPIKITSANGTIDNFYTSAGEKLKSIITSTNQELNAGPVTRVYLGGAEYVDGELERIKMMPIWIFILSLDILIFGKSRIMISSSQLVRSSF